MGHMGRLLIIIGSLILMLGTSGCSLLPNAELGLKKTALSGDIKLLATDIKLGQMLAMELTIPDDLDALHKEMWTVDYVINEQASDNSGEEHSDNSIDILIEAQDFDSYYTKEDIESIFIEATNSIYIQSDDGNYIYNPRLAIFKPEIKGTYHIEVYGYYKSTSPRFVSELELEVIE